MHGFKEAILKNIRPEMSISDILTDFPETKELFMMNGLGCFADNGAFLKTLTLSSFTKMRELNPEIFYSLLEKRIEASEVPMLYTEDAPPVKPDFLGYMVCPVKHLFKESYEEAMIKHLEKTGEKFVSFVPMGCGGADPYEAKVAGSSMSTGAAIYVLPWFFAKSCPNTEHTEIIWPEDGAMASPMYMLVKKKEKERLKPIIDYMTGTELADIMASSFFPSVHPEADNKLPEGAKIKWLGWDFIRGRDMKAFSDELNDNFMAKLREYRKEQGKKLHVIIR
jgi:hypothetical protein